MAYTPRANSAILRPRESVSYHWCQSLSRQWNAKFYASGDGAQRGRHAGTGFPLVRRHSSSVNVLAYEIMATRLLPPREWYTVLVRLGGFGVLHTFMPMNSPRCLISLLAMATHRHCRILPSVARLSSSSAGQLARFGQVVAWKRLMAHVYANTNGMVWRHCRGIRHEPGGGVVLQRNNRLAGLRCSGEPWHAQPVGHVFTRVSLEPRWQFKGRPPSLAAARYCRQKVDRPAQRPSIFVGRPTMWEVPIPPVRLPRRKSSMRVRGARL